jgi:hypothetical protein
MTVLGEDIVGTNGNNGSNGKNPSGAVPFESVLQVNVPKGRDGKHKQIVSRLLKDIVELRHGMALKIPLSDLPDTKENIRSALSRAARQEKIDIATSSNDDYLYVWKIVEAETL